MSALFRSTIIDLLDNALCKALRIVDSESLVQYVAKVLQVVRLKHNTAAVLLRVVLAASELVSKAHSESVLVYTRTDVGRHEVKEVANVTGVTVDVVVYADEVRRG